MAFPYKLHEQTYEEYIEAYDWYEKEPEMEIQKDGIMYTVLFYPSC